MQRQRTIATPDGQRAEVVDDFLKDRRFELDGWPSLLAELWRLEQVDFLFELLAQLARDFVCYFVLGAAQLAKLDQSVLPDGGRFDLSFCERVDLMERWLRLVA